jgi:hypothetical protein
MYQNHVSISLYLPQILAAGIIEFKHINTLAEIAVHNQQLHGAMPDNNSAGYF